MQFRVRPSSKKSNNNDTSAIQFPSIKSFNQNESPLPRSMASKIDHLESSLAMFQQLFRKERQSQNANTLDVQKRLDRVQYKIFTAEQDIRQLNEIREIRVPRQGYNNSNENDTSKNEIMVLKQVILQERQAHKQNLKHQNSLIEQLSIKQMRAEQELRQMIAHQRMDYQSRLSGQGEQMRQLETFKQRKIQQQYELMKGVISNAERKIFQELQRKIQNELIIKDYIEGKLIDLKQEISNDHKETIATESKFIKETKQSLQSLFALINNVRKELTQQLSQTQKLSVKSIQKLATTLDILRQKSNEDIKQIQSSQQEVSNQLVEIRNFVTNKLEQNRQFMSQFQEQILQRLQHSGSHDSTPHNSVDAQRFSLFQKEMNQWKSITQQKNLNVFKEISNTLKTMKLDWRKQNDELVSQVAALDQSMRNLKKNGPAELKKNIQAIVTIFNNEFDVLADQLQSLTEMIALAKRQNEKYLKEEAIRIKNDTIQQVKVILNQKMKQGNAYTDKAMIKSEQNLKVFISKQIKYGTDSSAKRLDKLQIQINQLQSSIKKTSLLTATQLEDYSIKLKNFNDSYKEYLQELRKEDLKKRMDLQESMRKNASNLMDICYKKCEFLIEGLKKNMEVMQKKEKVQYTQIVQTSKDELKKEIQGARLQWQKELSAGMEKLTKERQGSEEILHEAIEQSLVVTKNNLTNEQNNLKIQLQKKLNDFKIKQIQKEAENAKDQTDLKASLEKLIQQQQKQTGQIILAAKKDLQNQIIEIEKKNQKQREDIEKYIASMIEDVKKKTEAQLRANNEAQKNKQKENEQKVHKSKEQIDQKLQILSNQINVSSTKIEEVNKKMEQFMKTTSQKQIEAESQDKKIGQKEISHMREQLQGKIKQLEIRLQQLSKDNNDDQDEAINNLKKSTNKLEAMVFSQQAKNKAIIDKMVDDINKLSQNLQMIMNQMRQ